MFILNYQYGTEQRISDDSNEKIEWKPISFDTKGAEGNVEAVDFEKVFQLSQQ